MGANSAISWTHHTFNPWRGCTKVSAGCANCYAETMSKRNPGVLGIWGDNGTRVIAAESYWKQPLAWNRAAKAAGERHRVFCASLADVFEDRPELVAPRGRLMRLIDATRQLDWLLLTKRPENIVRMTRNEPGAWAGREYPPNVWLGTSIENHETAEERIPHLLKCPAAIRFLSCEPLLGPIYLNNIKYTSGTYGWLSAFNDGAWPELGKANWVICGGESGPGHRPMQVEWAQSLHDQCKSAGVAFFMKQASGPRPGMQGDLPDELFNCKEFPDGSN